ncbi:uncharacterized protein LOC132699970 [Cylas formicarius]|uniref:uncharacterized protein LOC132699970 n=1 Tax=Cylas formicarius TaxID=197179 RepID=UPI002958C5FD|nr:uncharacterized protein LOC132699970 [Cylas formicarius]
MLRQRLIKNYENGVDSTPRRRKSIEDNMVLNERKLAIYGLSFSLLVIFVKVFFANQDIIEKTIFERKLISYEVFTEDGRVVFTNSWQTVVRYSHFWVPLLCGFLTTYFTWIFVYLDSNVPGVQPPSPLSPQKYRMQSGHNFHLNYVFAILIGILVTTYMYLRGASIQY